MRRFWIVSCIILSLFEGLFQFYASANKVINGQALTYSVLACLFYGLVLICTWRLWRHRHAPSAKGLLFLRLGWVLATAVSFFLMRPVPPITLLFAFELLPCLQFFLAYKAKSVQ